MKLKTFLLLCLLSFSLCQTTWFGASDKYRCEEPTGENIIGVVPESQSILSETHKLVDSQVNLNI
jgi:hypothetical protein